jgi:hypothetical protein
MQTIEETLFANRIQKKKYARSNYPRTPLRTEVFFCHQNQNVKILVILQLYWNSFARYWDKLSRGTIIIEILSLLGESYHVLKFSQNTFSLWRIKVFLGSFVGIWLKMRGHLDQHGTTHTALLQHFLGDRYSTNVMWSDPNWRPKPDPLQHSVASSLQ